MFRESDYNPPRYHQSYIQKPLPSLQLQSQVSKFDEGETTSSSSITHLDPFNAATPEPIPATYDTSYDPSNPNADWAGMVPKQYQKKHVQNPSSQRSNIVQSEYGMVGKFESEPQRRRQGHGTMGDSQGQIIGGIAADTPYKTCYQSFQDQEKTSINQLSLQKREAPRRRLEPSYGLSGSSQSEGLPSQYSLNRFSSSSMEDEPTNSNGSLVGYKAPIRPGRSLLGDLGSSLVNRVPEYESSKPSSSERERERDTNKLLIVQNYKPNPGYSGRRMI